MATGTDSPGRQFNCSRKTLPMTATAPARARAHPDGDMGGCHEFRGHLYLPIRIMYCIAHTHFHFAKSNTFTIRKVLNIYLANNTPPTTTKNRHMHAHISIVVNGNGRIFTVSRDICSHLEIRVNRIFRIQSYIECVPRHFADIKRKLFAGFDYPVCAGVGLHCEMPSRSLPVNKKNANIK